MGWNVTTFLNCTSICRFSHTLYVCAYMWKKEHETEVEGCGVPRIRPQQMLIRVDLGTRSMRLMDRVQGQTSPRGAMILSLIVHTPPSYWPYPWALTLLSSPRITGRINLCLTAREKDRETVSRHGGEKKMEARQREKHTEALKNQ